MATSQFNSVADHLISPMQTTFMQGRNILEGVVILHETIHELHHKNQNGVIIKIDFEKAYDKVRCDFLLQTLRMKGSGGSIAVNVNDEVGPFFQTRKGLRQDDRLSPILFIIVADMLTLFINRAKADNQLG